LREAPNYAQIRSRPNDSRPAEHDHTVHRRHEVSDRLIQLAALQAHVVTRDQAIGHGMSRHSMSRHSISRLVESGSWRRLACGLFLTVPLDPSWDSHAWAAVLLGGVTPGAPA
jgi:predicted transcriptional regulator of viral defense system